MKQLKPINLHLNKLLNNVYNKHDNGVFIKVVENWEQVATPEWIKYATPIDIKWVKNEANLVIKANNKSMSSILFHDKEIVLTKLNKIFDNTFLFSKITIV